MKSRLYITVALVLSAAVAGAQTRKAVRAKSAQHKVAAAAKQSGPEHGMTPHARALYGEMLPNTQKVFVIDSVVVDKKNVISAIPLPAAYGRYVDYDTFFGKKTGNSDWVYVNGFGNRCYYTELGSDSISRLYMCDKVDDTWGTPQPVKAVNDHFTEISCPFMSSDGQTLYFSGVSADEGLGQRDIYMAKYDAEGAAFLQAENIGLPFNSAADECAYIVADADKLAWFASSRHQPEGKVCVYTFVPSDTRQNYNADDMEEGRLESLANLTRIRETWPTPEMRETAMKRLASLKANAATQNDSGKSIWFVVNDKVTYTDVSQFKSDETRRAYYETVRLRNDMTAKMAKLAAMRAAYHTATGQDRDVIGRQIQQLELQTWQVRQALRKCESDLRQTEGKLK